MSNGQGEQEPPSRTGNGELEEQPSSEPPRRKRILSFDLARGLAILFMIMQHCVITFGTEEVNEDGLGLVILLLGTAPAAPVFMFLMGVFFIYAGNKPVRTNLVRGVKLLVLGYLLNLLRFVLPALLLLGTGLATTEELEPDGPVGLLLMVDILQFAGLAYIAMTLLRHLVKGDIKVYLAAAVGVALATPLLYDAGTGTFLLGGFLRLLWGRDDGAYFTVFPWLLYPLLGMVLGEMLSERKSMETLSRKAMRVGVGAQLLGTLACVLAFGTRFEDFVVGDYPHTGAGTSLFLAGFVLVWLRLCQRGVRKVPAKLNSILFYWSRKVTTIYFVQWVLIGWGILLLGYQEQELAVVLVAIMVVAVLSHVLTKWYLEFKSSERFPAVLRLLS